jgi:1-deoxy-D-xylulose-5-phosphate reductoisomerase
MGLPDMKLPIQYALSWPDRIVNTYKRVDFREHNKLTFEPADLKTFRNLAIAIDAMNKGGNAPCVMNAANEVMVNAFLHNRVGFLEMSDMIEKTIEAVTFIEHPTLDDYRQSDAEARNYAAEFAKKSQLSMY